MEGKDNIENVERPKVPGPASIVLVMDENLESEWTEWGGIVAMGTVKVFPIRDRSIERGLAEKVEGHLCPDKEDMPKNFWKDGINAGKYVSFSSVAAVDVRGN